MAPFLPQLCCCINSAEDEKMLFIITNNCNGHINAMKSAIEQLKSKICQIFRNADVLRTCAQLLISATDIICICVCVYVHVNILIFPRICHRAKNTRLVGVENPENLKKTAKCVWYWRAVCVWPKEFTRYTHIHTHTYIHTYNYGAKAAIHTCVCVCARFGQRCLIIRADSSPFTSAPTYIAIHTHAHAHIQ